MTDINDLRARVAAKYSGGSQGANPFSAPTVHPAQQQADNPGVIQGFLQSALSGIPEIIGADPTPEAQAFRTEHPVAGFISEMIPLATPYIGWEAAAAKIPSLARGTEWAMTRMVGDAAVRAAKPIKSGAARMFVNMAPVDLGRLAVGSVAYPENFGELFADVLVGEAIGGGFGAAGGMLRLGGKAARAGINDVRDVDIFASPTLQLRALREMGAEPANAEFSREATEKMLIDQVLMESQVKAPISNKPLPYLQPLEHADPDTHGFLNFLFKPGGAESKGNNSGIWRQALHETDEKNIYSINSGEQKDILAALGTDDVGELAANGMHYRVVTVNTPTAAGRFSKLLGDNPAVVKVGDGEWMAREAGDGMHIPVKRLPPKPAAADPPIPEEFSQVGNAPSAPAVGDEVAAAVLSKPKTERAYGPAKVRVGDRFLVAKTDRPGFFFKDKEAVRQSNYAQWTRWRTAAQPFAHKGDIGNAADDELLSILSPLDYADAHRMTKATWVSKMSSKTTKRLTGAAGLTDSVTGRELAEGIYDAIAPSMMKQGRNSLYGRFLTTMRNRVRIIDHEVNTRIFGKTKIDGSIWSHLKKARRAGGAGSGSDHVADLIYAIPKEDWAPFVRAVTSRAPAEKVAEFAENGVVSEITHRAARALQDINQDYLEKVVYPMLESAGERSKFNALTGHIGLPAAKFGDFRMPLRDENGKLVYMITGKSGASLQRQADIFIAEAAEQGKVWKAAKAETSHTTMDRLDPEDRAIEDIFSEVAERIGRDESMDQIVNNAMKKINYRASDSGRPAMSAGTPGMYKLRSGVVYEADLPDKEEVLRAIISHYKALGNYSTMQGWTERWGNELTRFGKIEPTMFHDLMRKRAQYLGIEGRLTKALNKSLEPVLGPLLGPKAATKIAALSNTVLYNFNLAMFNPSFALLNALTPIMTVLPQLSFVLNSSRARANKIMLHMDVPAYDSTGLPVGSASVMDPLKILWQSFKDLRNPEPEQRRMLELLTDDGTLQAALFEEHVGPLARGGLSLKERFDQDGWVKLIGDGSTYMARKSEEISRLVSANAAYRLGQQLGYEGDRLLHFSRRFVESTNYLYGVTDRPRIFTGPIGSVFGLFKNWQFHYLGMLANYAGLAWKENVWSPMLWQTGSALAIGGLGATPLKHMADGIAAWHGSDKNGYQTMLREWPDAADEIWFGLPAFLGVSLQASATVPGTDVRNEITSLGNIVAVERGKAIGKALGGVIDRYRATGDVQLSDPNIRDQLVGALTPRSVHRLYSVVEGDYVRSMSTGYPTVRNLSAADKMLHGMGFNALEVERHRTVANQLFKDQERTRMLTTELGENYAQAALRGDTAQMESIIRQSQLFRIPLSKVMASSQNFHRREEDSTSFSKFSKTAAAEAEQLLEQSR